MDNTIKIKFQGLNYIIIEYPLGQLEKVCECGWHGTHYYDLTNHVCPRCNVSFRKTCPANPLVKPLPCTYSDQWVYRVDNPTNGGYDK